MKHSTIVLALVVVAFVLRVGWLLAAGVSELGFGDAPDYVRSAASVCAGDGYPVRGNLPFFRAPGLPFFLAIVTGCDLERVTVAKVAIVLVDSLLVAVVYFLGLAACGQRSIAVIAAALTAIHPGLIYQAADIRTEPLFMPLLALALAAVLQALRNPRPATYALAGAAAAAAALVRPVALAAVVFVFLVSLLTPGPVRKRFAGAIVVAAGALVVIAPWSAVMGAKYGELILVNDAGGYNLWRGAHPALYRALTSSTAGEYQRRALEFEYELSPAEAESVSRVAATPMTRSREWRRRAFELMQSDPLFAVKYAAFKAAQFWRPALFRYEYSRAIVVGSGLFNLALYVASGAGLFLLWRVNRLSASILVAWLLTAWISHVPYQVVSRFRSASVEPILLVLTAIALDAVWRRWTLLRRELEADAPHHGDSERP